MLGPSAIDLVGNKQYLCKRYPSIFTLFLRGFSPKWLQRAFLSNLSSYEMHELPEDKATQGKLLLSGCFMFIDTNAFKFVSGFNEKYFLYFEDFDLSKRISRLGNLMYAPQVKIVHTGGNTSAKGHWHILKFFQSGIRFFNTHGWRLL